MLSELMQELGNADLVELGMQAQAVRNEVFPHAIVTYTLESSDSSGEAIWTNNQDLFQFVRSVDTSAGAITPKCGPGLTAVDYLRLIALTRLIHPSLHIQVDLFTTGQKIGQLALAFGADDFGSLKGKPSLPVPEEELRQKIREAGFFPKRRDANYGYYWID